VAWVRDRDYLHRLTKPVQKFAMRSGLPAGHLRETGKVGDPVEQMRLACESVGGPSWCFAASEKDAKLADHAEAIQNEFFVELAMAGASGGRDQAQDGSGESAIIVESHPVGV